MIFAGVERGIGVAGTPSDQFSMIARLQACPAGPSAVASGELPTVDRRPLASPRRLRPEPKIHDGAELLGPHLVAAGEKLQGNVVRRSRAAQILHLASELRRGTDGIVESGRERAPCVMAPQSLWVHSAVKNCIGGKSRVPSREIECRASTPGMPDCEPPAIGRAGAEPLERLKWDNVAQSLDLEEATQKIAQRHRDQRIVGFLSAAGIEDQRSRGACGIAGTPVFQGAQGNLG